MSSLFPLKRSQRSFDVICSKKPPPGSKSDSHNRLRFALTTKSTSSDCEDPAAYGLDPSLYRTSAVSVPDIASTANGSTATTVVASPAAGGSQNGSLSSIHQSPTHSADNFSNAPTATVSASSSWPENEPRPKGLGLVYCILQHFPTRKRLRVVMLKTEGLAGELRPDLELQPVCKVNISPGKVKTQQVSIVKRGRDAVFNHEFFFDNVTSEDLEDKILSLSVCHSSAQKLQKDIVVGEIHLPLRDVAGLHSKKEVRIVEELKHHINPKKLGKLYITSCIEKEARRLTINLIKAEDLPKWGITGAPDVCIRITMSQGSNPPQTKQSRILKSTCRAVYNEAVMFLVSIKPADLKSTKITISVHDLQRTCTGDDLIGLAYLGELATDKSELDQWEKTVEHLGKEYKASHHLKLPNNTPQVHVSETQSDSE
ncbi:hypothetical protein QR680_011348 [Steinernema hermaphroditum]|uniref:C2 domain-containing protein n=1 Tax=Steinernema hermaphroditum TaxID=289476 RepID=A0AA39IT64_9BILA|nr:hypothetical protein QR680_011348 [Steinernema hermaphroditum]